MNHKQKLILPINYQLLNQLIATIKKLIGAYVIN